MSIEYIITDSMCADPLTKDLPHKVFNERVVRVGVLSPVMYCVSGSLYVIFINTIICAFWVLIIY